MKLLIFIALFCTTNLCQSQSNTAFVSNNASKMVVSSLFQKQKFSAYGLDSVTLPPGLRMRKTGRILVLLGSLTVISSIVVYSNADRHNYHYTLGVTVYSDPKVYLAPILMFAGLAMTTPGIILWTKGGKRYNHYIEKQGATTSLQWKGNAVSLTYRF